MSSAPLISYIFPTRISKSPFLVLYQLRLLPHSRQNPRSTSGEDSNVLYAPGDFEYDFNPSELGHLKYSTWMFTDVNTIAPVCFRHCPPVIIREEDWARTVAMGRFYHRRTRELYPDFNPPLSKDSTNSVT